MKLFESEAHGATCPDCGAPLEATSDAQGAEIEALPHECKAARPAGEDRDAEAADLFDGLRDQGQQVASPTEASHESPQTQTSHYLRDDTAQSLRERGYVIEEDVHGVRISSMSGTRGGASQLSATDVVSMAAELSGGIHPQTKLQVCSKCQARTPPGEANCQWCGEPFEDSAP